MTIETTTNRATYDGDGTSVDFSFPYKFNENADLVVILVDANGDPTTQVLGTDYTVTGATDDDGGTVTFTTAPEDGVSIVIYRDPPRTQGLDLVANDALPAESIENALDKGVMISQRLFDILGRVLRLSDSVVSDPTLELVPDAGKFLGWDDDGDLANKTLMDLATELPDATETVAGVAEIATDAEVRAGTDDTTIVTPKKLHSGVPECFVITVTADTSPPVEGTAPFTFRMPYAFTLDAVRASLVTAQTSGDIITIDINESGTSVLSTKLTIDNTEKTSTTAATAAVISDASLADDAEISIDVDQIGDGTARGLKVTLIGRRT